MRSRTFLLLFVFVACMILSPLSARSETLLYAKEKTVIGMLKSHTVKEGESLIEIARNFEIGYNEIVEANPGLDPFIPEEGVSVLIPAAWILPEVGKPKGIVINLSEMRLYYFPARRKSNIVTTFPIGIGSEGTDTPLGSFTVTQKMENPAWHVPESIRKEDPELPSVVPAGPDNPLGSHALRLSLGSVLIHGTNRPFAIGRKASHGCIRLYPEDMPKLFRMVPRGTTVTIVRQPVKVGVKNRGVYVEVHKDNEWKGPDYYDEAFQILRKKNLLKSVNAAKLRKAVREKKGIPVEISGRVLGNSPTHAGPSEDLADENEVSE